jgi:O-antigen ligase
LILAILLGVLFLVLAVKGLNNPFWGVVGLMCVTMINPGELNPIFAALRMEKIFVAVVLLSWIVHEKAVLPPISKKLVAFWFAMILGIPFAFWPGGAFDGTVAFFTVVLYHVMMINMINTQERFRAIITVYVALVGWIAGGAIWGYLHGEVNAGGAAHGLERAQGLTSSAGDPNSLGVRMVVAMPLMALLLFQGNKKQKLFGGLVLAMSMFTVALTGSRGSMLTMLVLFATFMFTRKKGLLLAPVAALLMATAWIALPQATKDRYLEIKDVVKDENLDESYLLRKYCREAGWNMFLDHPITGVGAGVFKYANGGQYWPVPGKKHWLQAHNTYIQLLADMGLVGTVVWLIFFSSLLKITWELRAYFRTRDVPGVFRYYPVACLFSIFVMLVNGYSTHQLYSGAWYFLAALSGALYYNIFPHEQWAAASHPQVKEAEALPVGALS